MSKNPSAFFAIFVNGRLMLEWDVRKECWGLAQRWVTQVPPEATYVEMSFGDVLKRIIVREVSVADLGGSEEARRIFSDSPLIVCIINGDAVPRNSAVNNFWDRPSIPNNVTHETRVAISIPAVQDRFL